MNSHEPEKQNPESLSLFFSVNDSSFSTSPSALELIDDHDAVPPPHWRARVRKRCHPRGLDSPPLRAIGSVTRNWDRASFVNLLRRRGNRPEDDGGESDGGEGRLDERVSDESGSDGSS